MKWNKITSVKDLESIVKRSQEKPVLIFKHSTRCSISSMALNRLEREWKEAYVDLIEPQYLDLIEHRELSNSISEDYGVDHESPQVLVVNKGKCSYNSSHMSINLSDILSEVN